MPHLVEVVRGLGYDDVWTQINSGNVVFEMGGRRVTLDRQPEGALEDDLGFELTTFVRSAAELRRTLARTPCVNIAAQAATPTCSASSYTRLTKH